MPPLRVLVSSAPGAGKTTLCVAVQEQLRAALPAGSVDGFLSRELHNARGFKVGYELYSLDGALRETIASSEGPESGTSVARYNVYVDALEDVVVPVFKRILSATGVRVCVFDDIGNMTCKSDAFTALAREVLESPDAGLHVLATVGMGGGGFILESRRIRGVQSTSLDPDTRDSLRESLVGRFHSVALREPDPSPDAGADGESDAEGSDGDLAEFDQWGGDRRQLGARRGMYRAGTAPTRPGAADSAAAPPHRGAPAQEEQGGPKGGTAQGRGHSASAAAAPGPSQDSWGGSQWTEPEVGGGRGHAWAQDTADAPSHGEQPHPAGSRGRGRAGRIAAAHRETAAAHTEASAVTMPTETYPATRSRGRGRGSTGAPAAAVPGAETAAVDGGHGDRWDRARPYGGAENGRGPSIIEWLDAIDPFLLPAYGKTIKERFDFVGELLEVYAEAVGSVSGKFYRDFGITKLGHKRLFEKWFREVGPGCGARVWGPERSRHDGVNTAGSYTGVRF